MHQAWTCARTRRPLPVVTLRRSVLGALLRMELTEMVDTANDSSSAPRPGRNRSSSLAQTTLT